MKKLARAATDAGLARARTEADKRRKTMDEETQSNKDPDAKMEEVKLFNKAMYTERLKVRREFVKNILEKDPLSGEPWNICAKKSRKVAKEYLQKWKPQMLHSDVGHGANMDPVHDLIEAQRMPGRRFVLVGQLQSGSWTAPAATKILKMPQHMQAIVNGQVGGGLKTRVVTNDRYRRTQ